MNTLWTLDNGIRTVHSGADYATVSEQRAHKRYCMVRPEDIAPKLERAGLITETRQGRFTGAGQAVMTVTDPHGLHIAGRMALEDPREIAAYTPQCRILFNHRGSSGLKICEGAAALWCSNEFTRPYYNLHHCGEEIREFLENPAEYVFPILNRAAGFVELVESLRDAPAGAAVRLFKGLRRFCPRLHASFSKHVGVRLGTGVETYRDARIYDMSPWGLVQAMTEPHRPGLDRLASRWVFGEQERRALTDPKTPVPLNMFDASVELN